MNIVNVKVAHIRPKYDNLKEWMKDSSNVYIGRRGVVLIDKRRFPEKDSIWANPFKIGDMTREEVIKKYEVYIRKRLEEEPELKEQLLSLKGKTLGCWCKPEACHGDVLMRLIMEYI